MSFYLQPIQSLDLSHCQQNEFCLSFNFLSLIGSQLWFQRSRKKFSNFPPCKLTKSRNLCLCGLLICNWVCYYECKSTKNVKKYRILGRISCVQASHYEELFCLVKHGWEEETLQYMLAKFTVAPFFLFFCIHSSINLWLHLLLLLPNNTAWVWDWCQAITFLKFPIVCHCSFSLS